MIVLQVTVVLTGPELRVYWKTRQRHPGRIAHGWELTRTAVRLEVPQENGGEAGKIVHIPRALVWRPAVQLLGWFK